MGEISWLAEYANASSPVKSSSRFHDCLMNR